MTDPKILREIAERTCIFDHAHFDDGNVPEPDVFLRHHESLKTDRKLITRLVPRYAVSLGFFEGYAKACNETIECELSAIVTQLMDTKRRIESLAAFANATEVRDTSARYVSELIERLARTGQQNIGIVKKPPPPPPPAAPPKPNEGMPTDEQIARFCVQWIGPHWDERDLRTAQENLAHPGHNISHVTAMRAAVAHFVKPFERECETLRSLNRWQGEEIERLRTALETRERDIAEVHELMTANGLPVDDLKSRVLSMLGKSKVAKSNDISDELAQAAADAANSLCRDPAECLAIECFTKEKARKAHSTPTAQRGSWEDRTFMFIEGARWQFAREKTLSAQLREYEVRIDETEKERIAMKEERDRALVKVRAWEERTGETQPRIVDAKLDGTPRALQRVKSSVDLLPYNLGGVPKPSVMKILDDEIAELAKLNTVSDGVQAGSRGMSLEEVVAKYGKGSSVAEAAIASLKEEPVRIANESAPGSLYAENGKLMFRSSSGQETAIGDPSAPCSSDRGIVFRDDEEREYWDEMTFVLARKGDTTAESVANAADEMVEERRKRMPHTTSDPIEFAKVVHGRIVELGHGCSWSKENGRIYARLWSGAKMLSMLDVDETIATGRTTNDAVELLLAHAPKQDEAKKVTDELMDEAAREASQCGDYMGTMHRLGLTEKQIRQIGDTPHTWGFVVLGYLAGSLRKSRKP